MNTFECSHCSSSFQSALGLKIHVQKKHATSHTKTCLKCNQTFATIASSLRHQTKCQGKMLQFGRKPTSTKNSHNSSSNIRHDNSNSNNSSNDNNVNDSSSTNNNTNGSAAAFGDHNTNANHGHNHVNSHNVNINLIPVTDEMFRQISHKMLHNNLDTFKESKTFVNHLLEKEGLIHSLFCTDKSRKVLLWKNGNANNQQVRDPHGKSFVEKQVAASQYHYQDMASKYFNLNLQGNAQDVEQTYISVFWSTLAQLKPETVNLLYKELGKQSPSTRVMDENNQYQPLLPDVPATMHTTVSKYAQSLSEIVTNEDTNMHEDNGEDEEDDEDKEPPSFEELNPYLNLPADVEVDRKFETELILALRKNDNAKFAQVEPLGTYATWIAKSFHASKIVNNTIQIQVTINDSIIFSEKIVRMVRFDLDRFLQIVREGSYIALDRYVAPPSFDQKRERAQYEANYAWYYGTTLVHDKPTFDRCNEEFIRGLMSC